MPSLTRRKYSILSFLTKNIHQILYREKLLKHVKIVHGTQAEDEVEFFV